MRTLPLEYSGTWQVGWRPARRLKEPELRGTTERKQAAGGPALDLQRLMPLDTCPGAGWFSRLPLGRRAAGLRRGRSRR